MYHSNHLCAAHVTFLFTKHAYAPAYSLVNTLVHTTYEEGDCTLAG